MFVKKKTIFLMIFIYVISLCINACDKIPADIEQKKYSYDELLSEFESILEQASSLYKEYEDSGNQELLDVFKYIGGGIDDKNNCINIRIINIDDKKIDIFKKYISDFDNINFMNSEEGFVEQ